MTRPTLTLLLIDDSPTDRELYRRYLLADTSYNYHFLEASTAETGLKYCRTEAINAIVLDYRLPDADGLQFIERLLAQVKAVLPPIVMVTGEGDEAIAVQAIKRGAEDYLVKHRLTPDLLQLALRSAIANAQLRLQLRHSDDRFRVSVENMLDCFGIYAAIRDTSGQIIDFRVEYLNAAALASTCMTAADIGKRLYELFPAHRATPLFEEYCRLVETGEPLVKEDWHYTNVLGTQSLDVLGTQSLPRVYDVRANRMGDGFVVSWRDVTARNQAEQALRESEEHLRYTVELNPQVPWAANAKGQITSFSDRWLALTGLTREQALGDGWVQAPHPDDRPAMVAAWQHSVQTGEPYDIEHRIRLADGSYRWMRSRALPRRNERGEIVHWYGATEDIHDRKQIEAEREDLLAREQLARTLAEQANRSKDEFVSLVAHELRSPLNSILGWAKLLQTHQLDPETTNKALETIARNTQAQAQLVEDLLDLSRMARGSLRMTMATVDLTDVIKTAVETVRPTAEAKGLQLTMQFHELPTVAGDMQRLQQVVLNLLTNAIKFTPQGGHINIALNDHNAQARLQIQDTGKGISADLLPHIFNRFQQDQQNATVKQGLGLGLSIARYIVEQHGGTIAAHSEGEGRGAIFTVMLPLMPVQSTPAEAAASPTSNRPRGLAGIRVLVVDDDLDMLNLTAFILEQAGAVVQTATRATEALARLDEFHPDVLVSDIAMPQQDGYELLQQVRSLDFGKHLPAIALTAFAGEVHQEDSRRAGFAYHLTKPVEIDVLVTAIDQLAQDQLA